MKKTKKHIFHFFQLVLVVFLTSSCTANKYLTVTVENPSSFSRIEEMVEIPLEKVSSKTKLKESQIYLLRNSSGETIPSQITYDGKLIFQSNLGANEKSEFRVIAGNEEFVPKPKVFGRHYPERKDDFAWENDRVGFRFYGTALKENDGPSNALDIWLKRTDKLVLDKWYKASVENNISYHVDHGEGCDPYGAGRSLGAGAMAPFVNEELILNENYSTYTILDKGPLRFVAKLMYPPIVIDGKEYTESRTVSLDAGSQLTKIEQEYSVDTPIKVAAGIVKRAKNDSILWHSGDNYFIYQEPASKENGQYYLGVVVPQGIENVFVHSYEYMHPLRKTKQHFSHTLGITDYTPGTPLTYYTGFGWNKYGFSDISTFSQYMTNFSTSLKEPFKITYK